MSTGQLTVEILGRVAYMAIGFLICLYLLSVGVL